MIVFVDTSVWIEFFRSAQGSVTRRLQGLLEDDVVAIAAPVWVELLGGAPVNAPLRRAFSALRIFYPSRDTWALVESWVERGARRGVRFGMGDLLIGATASEHGGLVWSLDDDFARLEKMGAIHRFR
jgi:predicted nucleic acid-binding protein